MQTKIRKNAAYGKRLKVPIPPGVRPEACVTLDLKIAYPFSLTPVERGNAR